MPYLSASAVVIRYEEALYQVYAPFTFNLLLTTSCVLCTACVAGAEDRNPPVGANEPKRVNEIRNSVISIQLQDAKNRLKPVGIFASPTNKPDVKDQRQQQRETADRTGVPGVNQTHVVNKPVSENRRPSKDATAAAVVSEVSALTESRDTGGNRSPVKKTSGAASPSRSAASPSRSTLADNKRAGQWLK